MKRHIKRNTILAAGLIAMLALVALFSIPAAGRAEFSVSATLSPTTFSVDDGAQLTITVNGTRSADLEIPETDTSSFEIIQRGRSSQINMINGNFSSAITFTCIVRGYTPGKYTIPPITIMSDGDSRTTEAIPFEITDSAQAGQSGSGTAVLPPTSASGAAAGGDTAFLRLNIDKTASYVGEIIPVEVKAYFKKGLRASLNSAPTLVGDGLVMPQLNEKPVQTEEILGNSRYSVLTWQTDISNIKEGKFTVHLELDATLLIPEKRMSTSIFGQSPFDDDFFDNVFGGYKEKPIKPVSKEMAFTILPLPEENRPASFTGAIGDFNLQVSATPIEAETGEPLTLTMTISGSGNFDRVEAPAFPDSDQWKTYSPAATFSKGKNGDHTGNKVFEQAIVARTGSVSAIPALSFSYFDPQKGRYITRESSPIPVTITAKTAAPTPTSTPTPAPPVSNAGTTPAATVDPQQRPESAPTPISGLAPLHLEAGTTSSAITPLYTRPLFLAVMAICVLALLMLTGLKIYRLREDARPEDRRKRQLSKALQESFRHMDQALTEGNSSTFLAACRITIQQHLGAIWHCQASAITSADLAARLSASSRLVEIFSVAEQAAYSGARLDRETMQDYAQAVRVELEELV